MSTSMPEIIIVVPAHSLSLAKGTGQAFTDFQRMNQNCNRVGPEDHESGQHSVHDKLGDGKGDRRGQQQHDHIEHETATRPHRKTDICILSFLNQDHAEYPAKRTPKQSKGNL